MLAAYERHTRAVNERNTFYVRREYGADFERIRERVADIPEPATWRPNLWTEKVRGADTLEILTPEDPRLHGGITSFRWKGHGSVPENGALAKKLLDDYGIFAVHRTAWPPAPAFA